MEQQDGFKPPGQGESSMGRLPPSPFGHESEGLTDGLNRLTLATASVTPLPTSSPVPSPSAPSRHRSPQPKLVTSSTTPTSSRTATIRRTPSSTSLRDERRLSTHVLQKQKSTGSLRSVSNNRATGTPPHTLSRRSSATHLNSPTMTSSWPKSPLETPVEAPPAPPTASSVGAAHFEKELRLHQAMNLQSKTIVVIQDACYGHRFSRPRTSKAALSTIVERPERLRAGILGISTAYVRVGSRYAGGLFAPHPDLDLNVIPPPPFQIRKSSRLVHLDSPAVTHVHGTKWMDDLKAMCDAAESRLALSGKELVRPRSAGKDDASKSQQKLHEGDLYLCSESLNAFQGALGGVCDAIDEVFSPGSTKRAFVCIRPPGHHCSSGHPSGFCWLNNVHVGIAHAAMTHGLTHAAILDFDLHHGDGSQAIAWEQNQRAISAAKNSPQFKKTMIGYYSLHDINSYPCEMGDEEKVRNASVCIDNAHGQSIWNVHLKPWRTTTEFWELYQEKYAVLIEKARDFLRFHTERLRESSSTIPPKAAIFVSAGFDASEWEGVGMQRHKVNVPTDFYAKFTADVVRLAEEAGLGTDGRIISVLEGGYSDRALASGVLSHMSGLADHHSRIPLTARPQENRLASEMMGRLGLKQEEDQLDQPISDVAPNTGSYDTQWWAPALLEELETLVYPPLLAPAKKPREKTGPTFFAPTQSSAAKAVIATRERRSQFDSEDLFVPLPEVDWATASHELFKALIPTDRTTTSCRPEELNAEASRARKERFLPAEAPETPRTSAERRMQLRERKAKVPSPPPPALTTPRKSSGRNSRRTTIASVNDLPDPSRETSSAPAIPKQRRRQSAASSILSDPDENRKESDRQTPPTASSRPSTSSGPKPSDSVLVKKTRVSSGSRTSTPKRSASPKKAPPVPKVPFSYTNTEPTSSTPDVVVNPQPKGEDIDSLTAGVRKLNIKLKVPSPAENEAREKKAAEERKKALEAKRRPAPKGPRKTTTISQNKPLAPRPKEGPSSRTLSPAESLPTSDSLIENARPFSSSAASVASTAGSPEMDITPSNGTSGLPEPAQRKPHPAIATPGQAEASAMDPPLMPGPVKTIMQPQPQIVVQPSPPPTSYGRNMLPQFTSTSPIPFAAPAAHATHQPMQHTFIPQNQGYGGQFAQFAQPYPAQQFGQPALPPHFESHQYAQGWPLQASSLTQPGQDQQNDQQQDQHQDHH